MYLLNLGYKWPIANAIEELEGIIVLPAHNDAERVRRNKLRDVALLLLDPQLYLAELPFEECSKVCTRLASFPWFLPGGTPTFDSTAEKKTEWKDRLFGAASTSWTGTVPKLEDAAEIISAAIEFQLEVGCSPIILPSPLAAEREDEAELQGDWLDVALDVADELDVAAPRLATVALSDQAINEACFEDAGFLDSVVDQVSSREVDGVYIVVVQTGPPGHPFATARNVCRAYLHLSARFGELEYDHVITNFADTFGLATLGAGATAFATGPSRSLRRSALGAYRDKGGGIALPQFYSHATAGEYLSETHLDQLVEAKLTRVIRDETPASKALLRGLASGGSASGLASWVESRNNYAMAHKHFVQAMHREGTRQSTGDIEHAVEWLEKAAANQL